MGNSLTLCLVRPSIADGTLNIESKKKILIQSDVEVEIKAPVFKDPHGEHR